LNLLPTYIDELLLSVHKDYVQGHWHHGWEVHMGSQC